MPLSPIKHSDWPLVTQPQPARVLMVAGLIVGVRGEVEVRQRFGPGESRFVDAAGGAALFAVVAFGEQQLGQERPVGQLLTTGGVGDLGVAVPDGRQPQ